jgi:hypothetical protein
MRSFGFRELALIPAPGCSATLADQLLQCKVGCCQIRNVPFWCLASCIFLAFSVGLLFFPGVRPAFFREKFRVRMR